MPLHALEDLDDALAATRAFLTPVGRTTWAKLALVAFFVGGTNVNTFQWSFGGGAGNGTTPMDTPFPPDLGPRVWLAILAVVAVAVTLGLALLLVGSVMEFVFVESLRSREVSVREYWREWWPKGLRLFGFRLLLGAFVLGSVLVFLAPFFLPLLDGGEFGAGVSVALVLALLPLFLVVALLTALVNSFTTAFVVPVMMLEDRGVLGGWRRLWPTITAHWQQYLAYAVAAFFLAIAGGVLVGIATAVIAVLLLVPFGLLFALGWGLTFVAQPLGVGVLVVVGVTFAFALLVVVALVQVPVQTYLRYYALLVLGDVEAEFDVVPDQRAEVRAESAG